VQGEGGLNAASAAWAQRIAALARRHGALLIVDDVQAGCGRTGSFFSFEPLGIEPDLVVLSKSISGFGLPMALLLVRPEHDQWQPAEHNGTFRGNTHAFVTATVAIEKFWARPGFEARIAERGRIVADALRDMAALVPGARVKGRGMMQGLCVRHGDLANRASKKAYELGLVIETAGPHDEVLKVLAPLTIALPDLHQGLALLHQALQWAVQAAVPQTLADPAPALPVAAG
jgi:diaminobutyrate-2-oxoglutarate transaminase